MALLQKMQEETAQLHRRFLEGQETAGRTFQTLLEQQQRLLQGGSASAGSTRHGRVQRRCRHRSLRCHIVHRQHVPRRAGLRPALRPALPTTGLPQPCSPW